MTEQELDRLLYRGESDALDYKSLQYRFVNGSELEKAELLKDCLAFANSWREGPAHILIGVQKTVGDAPTVEGIPKSHHFDDSSLQQFVNSKTNTPVDFLYHEVNYRGKSLGVIRFEFPQERPVSLTCDFGRLKKDVVYIRRGSSTSECKPPEIAQMGAAISQRKRLTFDLEFVNPQTDMVLGHAISVDSWGCPRPAWVDEPPPFSWLPDESMINPLGPRQRTLAEKFEAVQDIGRFAVINLRVANYGTGTAHDIEILIEIGNQMGLEFTDDLNPPARKYWNNTRIEQYEKTEVNAKVFKTHSGWVLRLNCAKLHAQQAFRFDQIWVANARCEPIKLLARIFADDLPGPITKELTVSILPKFCDYLPGHADYYGV